MMDDELKKEQNGRQRNRTWLILGGVILGGAVLCIAFVAAIVFIVFGFIRSSDVYQQALEEARSNSDIIQTLGEPVEPGWWVSGSIEVSGPSGSADIAIPISGPKNSGTMYAVATKTAGMWQFSILQVEVEGRSERINLLKPP